MLQIAGAVLEAERAHFATCSALAADGKQTADIRNANRAKAARVQAKIGTLEALQAQPHQAFWVGLKPLQFYDANGVLDATVQFRARPDRGVKDLERSRLARAFCVESGVMAAHARVQGAEPPMPMRRLISKVAARLLAVTVAGDVAPFRGCFYPKEPHFAAPTRAVANAITEGAIKTKMQLAVFSKEPGDESTETLHPWGYDGMALATMRTPLADDEHIPHDISDHGIREAWAAAFVASAKAGGADARCVVRSDC